MALALSHPGAPSLPRPLGKKDGGSSLPTPGVPPPPRGLAACHRWALLGRGLPGGRPALRRNSWDSPWPDAALTQAAVLVEISKEDTRPHKRHSLSFQITPHTQDLSAGCGHSVGGGGHHRENTVLDKSLT